MNKRHKIILSSNHIYKEIELAQDVSQLRIGTGVDCDVRMHRNLFFGPIEILLVRNDAVWTAHCSDNLYLSAGDVRKFITKQLTHGDSLEVKYQQTDNYVFSLDFLIDFDDGKRKYERCIHMSGTSAISIGQSSYNNIVLGSSFAANDQIRLLRCPDGYELEIQNAAYGVYINGRKARSGDVLRNSDFLSVADFFFYCKDDNLRTEIRNDLGINGLSFTDRVNQGIYPKFNNWF